MTNKQILLSYSATPSQAEPIKFESIFSISAILFSMTLTTVAALSETGLSRALSHRNKGNYLRARLTS